MTDNGGTSLRDGLFYGGVAYLFSYLFVYVAVLREGGVAEKVAKVIGEETTANPDGAAEFAQLLVPATWKYAGWLYHYSKGGSIGVSVNLLPGSYGLNHSLMFPGVSGEIDAVRSTILSNPLGLVDVAWVVQSPSALTLVTVTPTALLVAGAVCAYRNGDYSPIGGALAGSKVTAGFLVCSIIGVHLFTATMSGIELSASGAVTASGGASVQVIEAGVGGELGGGVAVEPVLSFGPSLGRAVLSGFFYPMIFGTIGGVVGSCVGLVALPGRILSGLFDR